MNKLLELARNSIESRFNNTTLKVGIDIKKKYSEKKACFVTLTKNGELRGCIGSLYPRQELYKDVIENALHAAFDDYRFSQVRKNELPEIKIELSILSIPEKIDFKNEKDLLRKLNKNLGIILEKGLNSATFLPQVWEEFPNKIDFLENLSLKARMERDAWKNANVYFYKIKSLKE